MQVVIDGAYRAPRELNFWFGVLMMGVTLALSLTGYLLVGPKGYWATAVATNLMAEVPWIGSAIQKIVVGRVWPSYIDSFFCPACGSTSGHAYRSGGDPYLSVSQARDPCEEPRPKKDSYFWPDQILKDAIACLAILLAVVGLTSISGVLLWDHQQIQPMNFRPAGMVFPFSLSIAQICACFLGSCNYSFVPCIMDIFTTFHWGLSPWSSIEYRIL